MTEMVKIKICKESGYRAGQYCNHVSEQYVPKSGLKAPVCPWHKLVHLSADGRFQVSSNCVSADAIINKPWFVLPPSMEYYYKTKNYQYQLLPPFAPGCSDNEGNPMELIYPKDGAKVYVPIEADGQRGRMICNAAHRLPGAKIFWHLDDKFVGESSAFQQMALEPSAGKHKLTLVDGSGNTLQINFEVLDKNK